MAAGELGAWENPEHKAHTQPSANRRTSPTGLTGPTYSARTLYIAQSALPTNSPPFCARLRCAVPWQAMCFANSHAHGTHTAKCQSSDKSDRSDRSDILCPHHALCTKCFASQRFPLLRPSSLRCAVVSQVLRKFFDFF